MIMDHSNELCCSRQWVCLGYTILQTETLTLSGPGNLAAAKSLKDVTGHQGMVIAMAGT